MRTRVHGLITGVSMSPSLPHSPAAASEGTGKALSPLPPRSNSSPAVVQTQPALLPHTCCIRVGFIATKDIKQGEEVLNVSFNSAIEHDVVGTIASKIDGNRSNCDFLHLLLLLLLLKGPVAV